MATNQRNLLKKATFWSLCCLLFSGPISAQKVYPAYGLNDFVETADPETYDSKQWDDLSSGLHAAWGSIDTLYKKGNVPANKIKQTKAVVWKGEKVNFIALAYTKNEIKDVKCVTSDLKVYLPSFRREMSNRTLSDTHSPTSSKFQTKYWLVPLERRIKQKTATSCPMFSIISPK